MKEGLEGKPKGVRGEGPGRGWEKETSGSKEVVRRNTEGKRNAPTKIIRSGGESNGEGRRITNGLIIKAYRNVQVQGPKSEKGQGTKNLRERARKKGK